jgi:hypothetical protein
MKEINGVASGDIFQATFTQRDPEANPKSPHTHTSTEVQRRAYRVHQRHGGIYGGYTLEDWLEAEHELDDEETPPPPKKDQVH